MTDYSAKMFFSVNRDKEKVQILNAFSKSINTFVFGPHGIGKTTMIKDIAEEYSSKIGQSVYVDCSLYQTANAVLREILLSLGSVIASKSNYELTKRLREKTRKLKLAIFLDHFENLKSNDILNIFLGLDFCVCLVADSFESYRMMNLSQRSRFVNVVKIEKLTDDQIKEALKEKASFKVSDELVRKIANKSDGNLTLALNILRRVEANHENVAVIEQIDFRDMTLNKVSNEENSILEILGQRARFPSGELYRLHREKSEYPKSERSFRNSMQDLCRKGLVRSIGNKKGRSYEIVKNTSEEDLKHG
jgi:Cdc6-like AAA superfamily ATPase